MKIYAFNFFIILVMEKNVIKSAYLDLKKEVESNPWSLTVQQKLEYLRNLVHSEIFKSLKWIYSDYWKKSTAYENFVKDPNERAQMEKTVMMKETSVNVSIEDIRNQISLAILTTMNTAQNIFDVKATSNEKKETINEKKVTSKKNINKSENGQQVKSKENNKPDTKMIYESYWEFNDKNQQIIKWMIIERKDEWLKMSTKSDLDSFSIKIGDKTITFDQIVLLFLWESELNSHDNKLRTYGKLTRNIFNQETLRKRYDEFRMAIINKWDWLSLEKSSPQIRNDYVVIIWRIPYSYTKLVSIFWASISTSRILSKDVYIELSKLIFWNSWKNILKWKNVKKDLETNLMTLQQYSEISDNKDIWNLSTSENEKVEEEQFQGERLDGQVKVEGPKKSEKEIELENNRLMIVKLAKKAMEGNPGLKEKWFWEYTLESNKSFCIEYKGQKLFVKSVWELIKWCKIGMVINGITFPGVMDEIFTKEFADQMRREVEEEKEKKLLEENIRRVKELEQEVRQLKKEKEIVVQKQEKQYKNKQELIEEQTTEILEDEDQIESQIEYLDIQNDEPSNGISQTIIENQNEKVGENEVQYTVEFYKEVENSKENSDWSAYENMSIVLDKFSLVLEKYFDSKRDSIQSYLKNSINSEWNGIMRDCKVRYDRMNPDYKNFVPDEKLIDEEIEGFFIEKESELIDDIKNYFDERGDLSVKKYCWNLLYKITHSVIEVDAWESFVDDMENRFKDSHKKNEKWIIKEIENEERQRKDEEEKIQKEIEIDDFCRKNGISLETYQIVDELAHSLKRIWSDYDRMMRYLLKLSKYKDLLREDEFENEIDDETVKKLASIWISVIYKKNKDSSKKKRKIWKIFWKK